nr:hypothetical protein [Tanacetum cinerariifolium]
MLDRTDFASWQQRIRLYCQGKENGVNILNSIDEGPYRIGTVRETLAESTEGAPQFGLEQLRVYSDLTPEEKDRLQLNSKFVNNMLPEWGRFVIAGVNPWGGNAAGYGGAQNRVGNVNPGQARPGQARPVKCYNCNGLRERSSFGRRAVVVSCRWTGQSFDDDVDEQPVQDLALNVDNVFQVDDCDAFDSNVDEAPTAQTMFMANLSYADPVIDEARPSYDSDILSEVPDHYHYEDAACAHHEEHVMHDSV